jgi:hypothetical protein
MAAFGAVSRRAGVLSTALLFCAIACGHRASDDSEAQNGAQDGSADDAVGSSGGSAPSGGSGGRGSGGSSGVAGSDGSSVAGSSGSGPSGAGSGPGGSGSGGSSAGDAASAGKYPLPDLPPNEISDSVLAQGESLYRTADDLRIAGNFPASFDTYVELMRLLQGAVGPLASRAHRTMARAEHDLGGLSRWRIEKDIVIGLQHYRASVAHCDVGGCDAVAMGSVGRVSEFEQELVAMGQPIPPWNPPSY